MAELLPVGTPAPDFSLPDGDDQPVRLSDLRGHNVVLAFYPADRSPVCTSQLSLYQETLPDIEGYEAQVLGISVDSPDSHKRWAADMHITFPLLSDASPKGAVAQTYGVYRADDGITDRALYVIDKQGIIRHTWVGANPGVAPGLNLVFDALQEMEGSGGR